MRTTSTILTLIALTVPAYAGDASTPQDSIHVQGMTVSELEKAGDQARATKNYPEAIQYFQAALRKDRKNAVLYNKLGIAELKNNDLNGARLGFGRAAKLDSKYSEAINNLGAAYYIQKSYGAAAKYFKRAVALDEVNPTYHVNLGAAWFSQKKMERAIAEYRRAMELDPDVFLHENRVGIAAQIASPEEQAQYSYLLAKIYAQRGDVEHCLRCLRKAKEEGYRNLASVYKDEAFSRMRDNTQLQEIVPPPQPK
jgi:tetratricopeptide (TPR) repeat protein